MSNTIYWRRRTARLQSFHDHFEELEGVLDTKAATSDDPEEKLVYMVVGSLAKEYHTIIQEYLDEGGW